MTDHANSSYTSFVAPLKRLFGDNVEPERRAIEDVLVTAKRTTYTPQQNRDWLRGATQKLVEQGLVRRIRTGGQNTSVTHLLLTARGKKALGEALPEDRRGAGTPAATTGGSVFAALLRQSEPTFDDLAQYIKRFCEVNDCQIEWTMTKREGVSASK